MKCPHCLTNFYSNPDVTHLGYDSADHWAVLNENCPSCEKKIITLRRSGLGTNQLPEDRLCYPQGTARSPLSKDVPNSFAIDYIEACLVLTTSPKASAALSRRCVQSIIREQLGIKRRDLSAEIEALIESKQLPTYLTDDIDAIRNIGNFAAHPMKSTNTGEVIQVEPGEAEWLLDVLESLFAFYFVQPAEARRKREALNAKLADAGKPAMKTTQESPASQV